LTVLDPDPESSQYGSGYREAISIWIHIDPYRNTGKNNVLINNTTHGSTDHLISVQSAAAGKAVHCHRKSRIRTGEAGRADGPGRHRARTPAPRGSTQVPALTQIWQPCLPYSAADPLESGSIMTTSQFGSGSVFIKKKLASWNKSAVENIPFSTLEVRFLLKSYVTDPKLLILDPVPEITCQVITDPYQDPTCRSLRIQIRLFRSFRIRILFVYFW